MPPRRFGIEFEACVVVAPFDGSNPYVWNEKVVSYLTFLHERYATLEEPIKNWCATFGNEIYVYSYFRRQSFNIQSGELTELHSRNSSHYDYTKPIIMPDSTVLCHGNFEKNGGPANSKENLRLDESRFTLNMEFITPILSSFDEWEMFKLAILPPEEMILPNQSQGIHLNIGVADLSLDQIKDIILNQYKPWEAAHAREIRPIPSENMARELDETNDQKISNVKLREYDSRSDPTLSLNVALNKYRSLHYKTSAEGILEFRLFSPTGSNIEKRMREVYAFFPPVAGGGGKGGRGGGGKGRPSRTRKKLKRTKRRRSSQAKQ